MERQRLSRYEILGRLGEGGMGEVYRARDPQLEREVALKVMPSETALDPERLARFQREARILAGLNHPRIVTIYSVEQADGVHFLTMELVEGEPLSRLIPEGGMPLRRILDVAVQLADALTAAHEREVVHRDLKPANVIVAENGWVKVLDFGLARRAIPPPPAGSGDELPTELLTEEGRLLGTVHYMPPEQLAGGRVDHRADLYSLGVVLYEMAAGRRPFAGDDRAALYASILRSQPPPLERARDDLPLRLRRLVGRCLEKDPTRRPRSARSLHDELQELEAELAGASKASPPGGAETRAGRSIAVLPFVNRTPDPENEYFSDGLSEDVINALTKIRQLQVAARTSAFSFKGETADVREIGRKLGVGFILEGSVRRAGGRLRVTAQLVSAADGYHLWSDQYDRDVDQIFDIQDEITLAIVDALKVELLAGEKTDATKRYTGDVDAYDHYLRGRFYWNKRTPEAFRKAIELFQAAVEKDPGYALAYAGLSDSYALLGDAGHNAIPPREAFALAQRAAERALELDERLAEAHTSLAHLRMHTFEWDAAERAFGRALELNPNYATAHHWQAFYFAFQGRFDRARAAMERALELDPVSLAIMTDLGVLHYYAGDYQRAIEQYEETLEMEPRFVRAFTTMGSAYGKMGLYDRAIAHFEEALRLSGDRLKIAGLGRVYALAGMRDEALEVLRELDELAAERYVSPYAVALIYAGLGDHDEAIARLETAVAGRASELIYISVDPYLEPLRPDPRFLKILRSLQLA